MRKFQSSIEDPLNQYSGDKQKRKAKRKFLILFLVIAVISAGVPLYIFMGKTQLVKANNATVEAAKDIHPLSLVYIDSEEKDKYSLSYGANDFVSSKPGEYKITYELKDLTTDKVKKCTLHFTVVDTTAPELTVYDTITVIVNKEYDLSKYVTVSDNSDTLSFENVTVEGDVNAAAAGTYPVKLAVKDSSGNETVKEIQVVIREMTTQEKFIDSIEGYWHIDLWTLRFRYDQGEYRLDAAYFMAQGGDRGTYKITRMEEDFSDVLLSWTYQRNNEQNKKQETVFIEANFAGGFIRVDLNDGEGLRKYQKVNDIKELEALIPQ